MFEFAWPWIFVLLPLPWLVRYLTTPARTAESGVLQIPFFASIQALASKTKRSQHQLRAKQYLAALVWLLLLTAAAGPQWLGDPIQLPRTGRDIVLALDISGSMRIPDMQLNNKEVDRLTVVKAAAKQFIAKRSGDRLGLILFGTKAYLQTPLTFDRKTVETMLDDASIGLAGQKTAIGDAVGLAVKRLQNIASKSRVLILLTDGSNNAGVLEPLQAAKLAAENDIKIYTIALGANRLIVSGLLGPRAINPSADLDEKTLKQIAKLTGGLFFRSTDTQSLNQVYKKIDKLEPISQKGAMFRPVKPLYYWPLALALVLAVGMSNLLFLKIRRQTTFHEKTDFIG